MEYRVLGYTVRINEMVARAQPQEINTFLREYEKNPRAHWTREIDTTLLPSFVSRVISVIRGIPPGETRTYGEIARELGSPRLARAVGMACKKNPVPILVPCHRVVSSTGIGGYSQGLDLKRALLGHEGSTWTNGMPHQHQ